MPLPRAGWPSGLIALLSVSGTSKHASTSEVIKADASTVLNASSAWRCRARPVATCRPLPDRPPLVSRCRRLATFLSQKETFSLLPGRSTTLLRGSARILAKMRRRIRDAWCDAAHPVFSFYKSL